MPTAHRPRIVIVGELLPGDPPRTCLSSRYVEAVERAGGRPLVIPYRPGPGFLADALALADGVLFTGGDDFATEGLGLGPTHPRAHPVPSVKQGADLALARAVLAGGIPVLGICYGMQLLGLAEGAGLFQHLPEDRPGARAHTGGVLHPVALARGTKLQQALGVATIDVISRHHQALSGVGSTWTVAGRDEEGLIEAVERSTHPFALGVQWHPEASPPGGPNDRLFAALVEAALDQATIRIGIPGALPT
ncbi:MAG: gamma-glutamyl-gamma-aminobutyrate hydrolase family protein [Planctomycetota bacterium]